VHNVCVCMRVLPKRRCCSGSYIYMYVHMYECKCKSALQTRLYLQSTEVHAAAHLSSSHKRGKQAITHLLALLREDGVVELHECHVLPGGGPHAEHAGVQHHHVGYQTSLQYNRWRMRCVVRDVSRRHLSIVSNGAIFD